MTFLIAVSISLAGGLGAMVRYAIDLLVPVELKKQMPWGTIIINISGSFLLGLVLGLSTKWITEPWLTMLTIGVLGGYTTFSTASYDTITLFREKRWISGLINSFGVLLVCVSSVSLGLWLGNLGLESGFPNAFLGYSTRFISHSQIIFPR